MTEINNLKNETLIIANIHMSLESQILIFRLHCLTIYNYSFKIIR